MMKKKFGIWFSVLLLAIVQSCSVNTETTYYKDAATSMESKILMDKSMMAMMSMMDSKQMPEKLGDLASLPSEWKSLYDIQKNGKFVINEKDATALKKLFLKVDKDKGEIMGLSLKYDKLLPEEIAQLLSSSSQLKKIPLSDVAKWDGKSLTIDTEKFNSGEFLSQIAKTSTDTESQPKNKQDSIEAYGRQMAQGMVGMMKMFNANFSNTLKFQKPIKNIVGKHDYVKQIDDKTIQISVNTHDLFDENKKLKNKDGKIVITTE